MHGAGFRMQGLRGLGRFGSGLWTSGFGFWGCGVVGLWGLWGCGFGRGGGGGSLHFGVTGSCG